jgi:hypothetical protein
MPRQKIELPSFNSVAAGQTATVTIPTGSRYHAIFLKYKGNANQATIEADLTQIRVKINGKVQRVATLEELNKINALNGYAFQAGLVPVFFSEPWRRNVVGEDTLAWGTDGVRTFQIEVDIDSGATAPTLEAFAIVDEVKAALTNIVKWRRQSIQNNQTGKLTVNTLPRIKGDIYQRMHCFEQAGGDISGIEVNLDRKETYTQTDQENSAVLAMQGMTPQTDVFHVIFDETQRLEDGLPLSNGDDEVQDFSVEWDMAAANSFTLLTEVRGKPD